MNYHWKYVHKFRGDCLIPLDPWVTYVCEKERIFAAGIWYSLFLCPTSIYTFLYSFMQGTASACQPQGKSVYDNFENINLFLVGLRTD